MDPEIEKLKELVAKNLALTEDTNRMVHKIRRTARWGTFFNLLYWFLILGTLGASYFYISPYLSSLQKLYSSLGSSSNTRTQNQTQTQNLLQAAAKYLPQH